MHCFESNLFQWADNMTHSAHLTDSSTLKEKHTSTRDLELELLHENGFCRLWTTPQRGQLKSDDSKLRRRTKPSKKIGTQIQGSKLRSQITKPTKGNNFTLITLQKN